MDQQLTYRPHQAVNIFHSKVEVDGGLRSPVPLAAGQPAGCRSESLDEGLSICTSLSHGAQGSTHAQLSIVSFYYISKVGG